MRWRLALGFFLLTMVSCGENDSKEARRLVERYNHLVCEAYRRGDATLITPIAGPIEARKLTGLIGVRLDAGVTLDAELLALTLIDVEQTQDELRIRTSETWRYRDLKIGSGEQVGEASRDAYSMLYVFKKIDGKWLVDKISFTEPPTVGRKSGLWSVDSHIQNDTEATRKKKE